MDSYSVNPLVLSCIDIHLSLSITTYIDLSPLLFLCHSFLTKSEHMQQENIYISFCLTHIPHFTHTQSLFNFHTFPPPPSSEFLQNYCCDTCLERAFFALDAPPHTLTPAHTLLTPADDGNLQAVALATAAVSNSNFETPVAAEVSAMCKGKGGRKVAGRKLAKEQALKEEGLDRDDHPYASADFPASGLDRHPGRGGSNEGYEDEEQMDRVGVIGTTEGDGGRRRRPARQRKVTTRYKEAIKNLVEDAVEVRRGTLGANLSRA